MVTNTGRCNYSPWVTDTGRPKENRWISLFHSTGGALCLSFIVNIVLIYRVRAWVRVSIRVSVRVKVSIM